MIIRKTILIFVGFVVWMGSFLSANNLSEPKIIPLPEDTTFKLVQDDPVIAMLDSMLALKYFEVSKSAIHNKIKNRYGFDADSIPTYNDSVYKSRLAKLNEGSPISLDYNEYVKGYINLYAFRRREQVMKMLGLAEYYFPMFEEKLDKYDMPLELKYLAIVESALNANAKSRVGATGLWQFMYGTGKMYNLKVDSYVDERSDPFKSTDAACQYMKFLYKMFGDWQLVLAAYNAGPGTVNKAIRRSGGKKNYWELRPHLPSETRGYVPAFIAVNYVMKYAEEHNLHTIKPIFYNYEVDTISIEGDVSFSQISGVLGIPVEHLEFLNPVYKKNVVPKAAADKKNTLVLPSQLVAMYMNNDSAICAYNKSSSIADTENFTPTSAAKVDKIHLVRNGEHLSLIAKKYNCSVSEIRAWNNLKSNKIYKGQKLTIQMEDSYASKVVTKKPEVATNQNSSSANETVKKSTTPSNLNYVYYTIQPGDTLWDIANKYEGVSIDDIKKLNNIKNAKSIKPGTKIKVSVTG